MEVPARCQGVGTENFIPRTNPVQVDAGVAANIKYLPGDRRSGGLMPKRISSGAMGIAAVLAVLATAYTVLEKRAVVEAAGTQAPRFEVDPMWPKPLPNHWVMGNTIGVSVDSKDHIWIVHRQASLEAMENYGAANPPGPKRRAGVVEAECCEPAPPVLEFAEADGWMASEFPGRRLKPRESAIAMEAVQQRRTVYVNDPAAGRYSLGDEFHAKSLMASPLVVSNEIIGAAVFLQASETDYFNDDLAAKATILAGQLGNLLEANRLTEESREEDRHAEILAEVAQAVHAVSDSSAVAQAVADRLRNLLRTRLVCILLRRGATVGLHAVAAESEQLAASVRARFESKGLQFAADLTARAIAAGGPITVAIDPATHALGDLVPAGMLLAAPISISCAEGAVLVYPRKEGVFSSAEKSLLSTVAGFGAVAIANAELYGTAPVRAHELHELLDILSELSSVGNLDEFLRQFAVRAAAFLGFGRAFVGLLEGEKFRIRWRAENGQP